MSEIIPEQSNVATPARPTLAWLQLWRGWGWFVLALFGAMFVGPKLHEWGLNEYTQRWLGTCFKIASGAWGAFRISRGLCRIDPAATSDPMAFAILHLARALIVGSTIIAICVAV